ncbi:MAG TPA: GTPase HflX [Thermoanaerobaculia bacterium]|nr:GTPase HflX [Thermoanaerobaculia bacterium]
MSTDPAFYPSNRRPNRLDGGGQPATEKAFLVGVILPTQPAFVVEEHLDELEQLVGSAGVEVVGRAVQARKALDAATFIGSGKAKEIAETARGLGAAMLVFDDDLSASQVKNLEEVAQLPVLDRSGVILEIFNQRARTSEARTQVELARSKYLLPRLTRQWSHLSRQGGGKGTRGGEGEKQLEADRRILRGRIKHLEADLKQIERTREVQRRGRTQIPEVALTGYTNAGKSTLFNRLTKAGTLAEDRLFATLDAKLRRGVVDGSGPVVYADTVGFIRKLPHHLVSSFRSTLGEAAAADLVIHLIDRSHPRWQEQMEVADAVLADLGVEPEKIVKVFNKRDRLAPEEEPGPGEIWISAATGEGMDQLHAALAERL